MWDGVYHIPTIYMPMVCTTAGGQKNYSLLKKGARSEAKIANIQRYWVGHNKLQISTGGFVSAEKKEQSR